MFSVLNCRSALRFLRHALICMPLCQRTRCETLRISRGTSLQPVLRHHFGSASQFCSIGTSVLLVMSVCHRVSFPLHWADPRPRHPSCAWVPSAVSLGARVAVSLPCFELHMSAVGECVLLTRQRVGPLARVACAARLCSPCTSGFHSL